MNKKLYQVNIISIKTIKLVVSFKEVKNHS